VKRFQFKRLLLAKKSENHLELDKVPLRMELTAQPDNLKCDEVKNEITWINTDNLNDLLYS
jgi:hypothetical protein